ncbi:MAG: hypothetical protein GY943_02215 [Chloroflexi bacterium]|nr:hypothetical protein [Chloroflexota bacterium]
MKLCILFIFACLTAVTFTLLVPQKRVAGKTAVSITTPLPLNQWQRHVLAIQIEPKLWLPLLISSVH